jgi:hypothetical protein
MVVTQMDFRWIKEASQTGDYCISKNAMLRAARQASLGKLGIGYSPAKNACSGLTARYENDGHVDLNLWFLKD